MTMQESIFMYHRNKNVARSSDGQHFHEKLQNIPLNKQHTRSESFIVLALYYASLTLK